MVIASLITSSGVTTGAKTVGKTVDLRPVSATDRPTNCVVDPWRQGVDATASIGMDFCEKVSWPRSGVLLWGLILKRGLWAETAVRCTKSTESRYQAWSGVRGVSGVGGSLGLYDRGGRSCGCRVEDLQGYDRERPHS